MATAGNWCLIESDPGVFTELIRGFGCKGIQVEELYSLDEETFDQLKPVHGLIFLFKWRPGDEPSGLVVKDTRLDSIYFTQQVIQNACASQAIINLLLNCTHSDVEMGDILTEFKTFTTGFDPASRGLCLSNSEPIRTVHNSFARQQIFELEPKIQDKEDVFHFISYMPINGRVYELDGLREGPIDLGKIPDEGDWLALAKPVIQERIQKYSDGEIHFNLMAVISDRRLKYQRRLEELAAADATDASADEIYRLQTLIAEEDDKFERYRAENVRRKHNYVPFIVELLKILAKEGKLVDLVKQAKEKAKERMEEEQKKKETEEKKEVKT